MKRAKKQPIPVAPKLSAKSHRESEEITITRAQFDVVWEALNFAMYECQTAIENMNDKADPMFDDVNLAVHEQAFCRFNRLRYGLSWHAGVSFNSTFDHELFPSGFVPPRRDAA